MQNIIPKYKLVQIACKYFNSFKPFTYTNLKVYGSLGYMVAIQMKC